MKVELELDAETLENLPFAFGMACGALHVNGTGDASERELCKRAFRRLHTLFDAMVKAGAFSGSSR